jgi:hypothetical protein
MANMHPPAVPEEPPAVISAADLCALLAVVGGIAFDERRDAALIRLLLDAGSRSRPRFVAPVTQLPCNSASVGGD